MKLPHAKFLLAVMLATVANLVLHAVAYFAFLKDFFLAHPAVSADFQRQLARPPDQLVGWAMAATAVSMGLLITTVMRWSGATTFSSGLKNGFVLAALYWSSVNFGLYAASNHFSQASVFVDLLSSVTAMTLSGAVAASMLGPGRSMHGERDVNGAVVT